MLSPACLGGVYSSGTPRSYPPTMASDLARRAGHDRSLMQRLLDVGGSGSSSSGSFDWFTLLDTQYRMHPDISSFPSKRFYAGGVRDAPCVVANVSIPWTRRNCGGDSVRSSSSSSMRRGGGIGDGSSSPGWLKAPFVFVNVVSGNEERAGGREEEEEEEEGDRLASAILRRLSWPRFSPRSYRLSCPR